MVNRTEPPAAGSFRDPVCGMTVAPDSPWRTTYEGKEYTFCCQPCLVKFQADPEKYLGAAPQAPLKPRV